METILTPAERYLEFLGFYKVEFANPISNGNTMGYESDSSTIIYMKTAGDEWAVTFRTKVPNEYSKVFIHSYDDHVTLVSDIFQIKHMIGFLYRLEELRGVPILTPEWKQGIENALQKEEV